MKKILILILGMFLLFSCGENKVEEKKEVKKIEKIDNSEEERHKKIKIKQNNYPKIEINKLSTELYNKYKNKQEVDRNFYERHIIYGEGIIVDVKYSGKAAMVLFNSNKKKTLDDDVFNNPYIVKVKGEYPLGLKKGDKVKFSGPVGRLGGDHNSVGGNGAWTIYLDNWKNKEYTFITKIY